MLLQGMAATMICIKKWIKDQINQIIGINFKIYRLFALITQKEYSVWLITLTRIYWTMLQEGIPLRWGKSLIHTLSKR